MIRGMNEDRFWQLIDMIERAQIGEARDDEAALRPLLEALSNETEDDIRAFEDQLARALYRLDGKKLANEAGESGGSDDGFLYARCWVVAQGRERYQAVIADPSRMPKTVDEWFEPLLYVAAEAWQEKTGEEWDHEPAVSWETGSNGEAWK
jgi:hypothetical protein